MKNTNDKVSKHIEFIEKHFLHGRFLRYVDRKLKHKLSFDEDAILKNLNSIFTLYRQEPFTMPKKNESAILLCSGGLDSIATWAYLMDRYHIHVYPVHVDYGKKKQKESLYYFSDLFKKRFKKYYHAPEVILLNNLYPFFNVSESIPKEMMQENILFPPPGKESELPAHFAAIANPSRFLLYGSCAYTYLLRLSVEMGKDIRTIFTALTPEDSFYARESTLTLLRSVNLSLCLLHGDFSIQFTALGLENDPFSHTKKDLISFCDEKKIPIEKSWSCESDGKLHCGTCFSCQGRKELFKMCNYYDKTTYQKVQNSQIRQYVSRIKNAIFSKTFS